LGRRFLRSFQRIPLGRVALVTDVEWIRASAHLFMPFFYRTLRIIGAADLNAASAWIRRDAESGKSLLY
jgi:hypothetical protein